MNKLLCVLTAVLVFSACRKDKEVSNGNGNNPQPPTTQLDSFPMNVGFTWKYYTESIIDCAGIILIDNYWDSYWNVLSDTTINGIPSAKISQLDSNYDGTTHFAFSYYANKLDGFYGMAVENSGSLFFLRSTELESKSQFSLLATFGNKLTGIDTVFVPDTPLYLLKFPSTTNDIWASHEYGIPNLIKRKWIGNAIITTSAGTFNCMKLQVISDQDNNNQPDSASVTIYQYFSTKGLIQEERHDSINFGNGNVGKLNQITKLIQVNF